MAVQQTFSVVAEAEKYAGKVPYVFGGGSPRRGWDCSGFVNYVLGHDLGMTLPGGVKGFTGNTHGPVVVQYVTWSGAKTVASPAPGDLVIWPGLGAGGHIGFVTGPNRMISALDPQYGTANTPIAGFGPAGVKLIYRRITGVTGGQVGVGAQGQSQTANQVAADLLAAAGVGLVAVGGLVAVVVLGAVVAGGLVVLAAGVLAGRGQ